MYNPFAGHPSEPWWRLTQYIEDSADAEIMTIDGLMGVYYPGHEGYWIDYDEGILYGFDSEAVEADQG